MHNIVCIYTHILYQIYLHFVSSSLLHNGNRRVAILFLGVRSFYLPPKKHPQGRHHGKRQRFPRHVSGLRFSPLTMQRPLCHSVPFSWSHASGHSEAVHSRIFVGRSQKISNWCQEKKQKKCVYIYTCICICESCYIAYRILNQQKQNWWFGLVVWSWGQGHVFLVGL